MEKLPVRTKWIEMDGAKFAIAPLTMRQVTEFLNRQRDTARDSKLSDDGKMEELAKNTRQMVANSLNNAAGENGYTEQDVFDQIDTLAFVKLKDEVLKFSGIELAPPTKEEKEVGEAAAAS